MNKFFEDETLRQDPAQADVPALHHRALADACSVVDSLDAKCREELITWFCHQQLQPYQMLFVDATGLGRTEERYAWILRHLKSYEERYGDVYPPAWGVCYQLCLTFCQTTREQLAECAGLARGGAKDLEVGALVQVIPPIGAEGLNRRPPVGARRLFLGPGFRLAARWNRLGKAVKTRKKTGKHG